MLVVGGNSKSRGLAKFFAISTSIIFLDQATKIAVTRNFLLGETLAIIPGFFNLTYIRNPGIAFGMLPARSGWLHWLLLATPLLVCAFLFAWYRRMEPGRLVERCALPLLMGGALANVLDRFRLGYVVDFLDFHWQGKAHYPAFNVADIAVCTGVGLLFLASLRKEQKEGLKHV